MSAAEPSKNAQLHAASRDRERRARPRPRPRLSAERRFVGAGLPALGQSAERRVAGAGLPALGQSADRRVAGAGLPALGRHYSEHSCPGGSAAASAASVGAHH